MAVLEVIVSAKLDGKPVATFPVIKRIEVDEAQSFSYEVATGGGYAAIPSAQIDTVQALVIRADKALTFRFQNQTDGGLVLNAGGLLVVLDATINSGASTNVTASNASGATAVVQGLAAGT